MHSWHFVITWPVARPGDGPGGVQKAKSEKHYRNHRAFHSLLITQYEIQSGLIKQNLGRVGKLCSQMFRLPRVFKDTFSPSGRHISPTQTPLTEYDRRGVPVSDSTVPDLGRHSWVGTDVLHFCHLYSSVSCVNAVPKKQHQLYTLTSSCFFVTLAWAS